MSYDELINSLKGTDNTSDSRDSLSLDELRKNIAPNSVEDTINGYDIFENPDDENDPQNYYIVHDEYENIGVRIIMILSILILSAVIFVLYKNIAPLEKPTKTKPAMITTKIEEPDYEDFGWIQEPEDEPEEIILEETTPEDTEATTEEATEITTTVETTILPETEPKTEPEMELPLETEPEMETEPETIVETEVPPIEMPPENITGLVVIIDGEVVLVQ